MYRGHRAGVAGVYNRATYIKEMREALERWADHVKASHSELTMKGKSRAVLGIDAAWTPTQPNGVAVAREETTGWRLVAVANSHRRFCDLEGLEDDLLPKPSNLLGAARKHCGQPIDVVAVDMPLSRVPILGRRASDNAVSAAYGAKQCGTHSPSLTRPGPLSDALRDGFAQATSASRK
jgi:hypothetical protein